MRRALTAVVVIVAIGVAGALVLSFRTARPYAGYPGRERFVELMPGDGVQAIGRKLVDAGVVRDIWVYRLALWRSGMARRLKAGEYRFDRPLSAPEVIAKIARGEVYLRAVTFPEGLTIREMSRIFEARGLGPAATFVDAAADASLVSDLDPAARTLEGYLFPETYLLPRRAGAHDLVRMMVARFRQVFTPRLLAEAQARGQGVHTTVTLASLVEKETAKMEERPVVAAVYLRRLEVGMALQCDPTVIYALELSGDYHGTLTHEGLRVNSPYNTYRYPGLPPGPIASPGRTALEAAAHPAGTDYLYFVSRNDGSHVFARTLDEHNHNVFTYQVQPFRQKHLAGARH